MAALTGGPEAETLLRRRGAHRPRGAGGELLAVHVQRTDGLAVATPAALRRSAGRSSRASAARSTRWSARTSPTAVVDFARGVNATQIVVGVCRRPRWRALLERRRARGSRGCPGRSTCTW